LKSDALFQQAGELYANVVLASISGDGGSTGGAARASSQGMPGAVGATVNELMPEAAPPAEVSGTAAAGNDGVISALMLEAAPVDVSGMTTPGAGTVISGLMPEVAPSVDVSGTAALANVELSRLGGAEDGSAAAQPPDSANGVNTGITGATGIVPAEVADDGTSAVMGVVGSVAKLGVMPAMPLGGHDVMVPMPIPAIGAPRFM
jgi:hypothetical protein